MKKIILASSSPRRKALLEQIKIPFTVEVSNSEEIVNEKDTPQDTVERLSLEKAKLIAAKHTGEDVVVIGSDTMVVFHNKKIGKPKDILDATNILTQLSGNKHTVVTGLTVIDIKTNKTKTLSVSSDVYFKKLSASDIASYVATGEPMDKAGGYGIQELGGMFVEKIDGDYFSVVGLPLPSLMDILKDFGISIW